MTKIDQLSPAARRAWKRIKSDFPLWVAHLDIRDGELEFAVPAPPGSSAGHLVAFSDQNQLWVRFSPPQMCYSADDESEMISLIQGLTSDAIVFKVVRRSDEWVETTLAQALQPCEPIPGHSIQFLSWSGRFDRFF
jgi:hypothetical protein